MFMLNLFRIPMYSYIDTSKRSLLRSYVDTVDDNLDRSNTKSRTGRHVHSMTTSESGDRTGSRARGGRWNQVASHAAFYEEDDNNGF